MRADYKVNGRSLENVNAESNRPGGEMNYILKCTESSCYGLNVSCIMHGRPLHYLNVRTFETDDVAKMHDAAVPVHLPGVVTFNSESETG